MANDGKDGNGLQYEHCSKLENVTYRIVGSVYSSQEDDLRKSNGYYKILVDWGPFRRQCPEN